MDRYFTTQDLADIFRITQQGVRYYYLKFEIGQKQGRDILFTAQDIKRIKELRSVETRGRKKK